ncbi:MAG: hypothetical protein IJZ24_02595 [Clostridia bacterium]|nr:hypothetical protein [Clostridia bacterium]
MKPTPPHLRAELAMAKTQTEPLQKFRPPRKATKKRGTTERKVASIASTPGIGDPMMGCFFQKFERFSLVHKIFMDFYLKIWYHISVK